MHKSKSGTMRIVAFTELGIDCVYTVEASLAGSDCIHFGPQELLRMGHSICLRYFSLVLPMICKVLL